MNLRFHPKAAKAAAKLPLEKRRRLAAALVALPEALGDVHRHAGLGLRKLTGEHYEVRIGRDIRAVFGLDAGEIVVKCIGNHDQVKRYLKGG